MVLIEGGRFVLMSVLVVCWYSMGFMGAVLLFVVVLRMFVSMVLVKAG